jgi:hypothetical protein
MNLLYSSIAKLSLAVYVLITICYFYGILDLDQPRAITEQTDKKTRSKLAPLSTYKQRYNDTLVRRAEWDKCDEDNECRYHRIKNTWHPTKFAIISDTWNLCTNNSGSDLTLFGYVWTRVTSFKVRQAIRRTWANRTLFPALHVGFILGTSLKESLNLNVKKENEKYGDIIQGDFLDTYQNLTFKSLTAWRWIIHNCKNAKFYLKIDGLYLKKFLFHFCRLKCLFQKDDVFLNTEFFIQFLTSQHELSNTSFAGLVESDGQPHRSSDSAYFVDMKQWPYPSFPVYMRGAATCLTNDMPTRLYSVSFTYRDLWLSGQFFLSFFLT